MGDAKKKTGGFHTFNCILLKQGGYQLIAFVASAKSIWQFSEINRRDSDKRKGYQRVLSASRVEKLRKYIEKGNPIPNSILLSIDPGYQLTGTGLLRKIKIPRTQTAAWVIDGQHRLAAANDASVDLDMVVIAFLGLEYESQIEQFVTINREAKGVATSLYLDLLSHLPKNKTEIEIANERAGDILNALRMNEDSVFFQKIAVVVSPQKGQISNTNFVRKIAPLLRNQLVSYSLEEQIGILDNYFSAIQQIFPTEFNEPKSLFFRTVGFGAMMNVLPDIFNLVLRRSSGFQVSDIAKILKLVEDFDFADWYKMGSGTSAEKYSGAAFKEFFDSRTEDVKKVTSLKL